MNLHPANGPNIVPIYEINEYEGRQYYSMKLVGGGSLVKQAKGFVENPKAAIKLMLPVIRAVHFAHQRGILHRDLKPANILFDAQASLTWPTSGWPNRKAAVTWLNRAQSLARRRTCRQNNFRAGEPADYIRGHLKSGRDSL